jgi:O-antigen biosynthesis protein
MDGNNWTDPDLRSAGQGRMDQNGAGTVRSAEKLLALLEEKSEWIADLDQTIAANETALQERTRKVAELEQALEQVTASRSWKLANRLSQVGRRLLPPGSRRRHLIRSSYRMARALYRLRVREYRETKLAALRRAASRMIKPSIASGFDESEQARLIRLPSFEKVDVSIIIPFFNHVHDTLACIESIGRLTTGRSYEVIVVDDASTEPTAELIRRIDGLVLIQNHQNLGFVGSCNRGAAAGRGDFLVFLNNDTVVSAGWLEALARTFKDVPDAGYVGAKLVYPDGRLQEAGSVIWRDASGWNYGKFDDAGHPRYNFTREVDYCSGACVMVPRLLFQELGGFDTRYSPAYYEDTDLAFKIRHAGHKVIYQPRARITHHEGLTSGTSLDSGVKSYQRVNKSKFMERWRLQLDDHSPEPTGATDLNEYTRRMDLVSRGHILVIDAHLLAPDRDSGSFRMMEIVRAFRRRGHHVTFIPSNLAVRNPYLQDLQSIGVEVIHQAYYPSIIDYLKQHGREIDLAIVSRLDVAARHMAAVRRFAPQAKVVFDTVDLHYVRAERTAQLTNNPAQLAAVADRKKKEIQLAYRADLTLVVSAIEKEILDKECPGIDVRILSNMRPLEQGPTPGFDGRRDLIFIGGFEHAPNPDAVLYFAKEIFPRIQQTIPQAVFQVVGPDPTPEICQLASPSIKILGYVPEVKPIFNQARISVAPLRFGAGVKGKVNQSMALGVPTVVTSIAAEGMHLTHEHDTMIADDPAAFADAVVRLYGSRELWERLSKNGKANVRKHFSVEASSDRIDELLEWAGLSAPRSARAFQPRNWRRTSIAPSTWPGVAP